MKKLFKRIWILPLLVFLYGCATAELSEPAAEADTADMAAAEEPAEKEAVWVTINVEEYFVSKETVKYEDGFVDGYRLYDYDDSGRILRKTHVGADERVISDESFSYNTDGLLVKSSFISGGEEVSYSEFSYNENMLLIEESYFNPEGELLAVSSYKYDESGRRSKWISGDSGGIPMMYTEYEYKGDKLVQMNYHMPSGELEGFSQLEYEADILVLEASYSANSKLEKKTEYILTGDQVSSVQYYMGNNLIRTVEFEYDDAGNAVMEKTMNRRGDVIDIIEKEYVVFSVEKTVLQ